MPVFKASAQANAPIALFTFDLTNFPQWAKDMRRWEIIAFGAFPFAMFFSTFAMDTYRWNAETNMDWGSDARRYAPWPLKAAGAIEMTSKEREITLISAASLSAVIAVADLIIIQIKRHNERRRIENIPGGTAIIIRTPYPEIEQGGEFETGREIVPDGADTDEVSNGAVDFSGP